MLTERADVDEMVVVDEIVLVVDVEDEVVDMVVVKVEVVVELDRV